MSTYRKKLIEVALPLEAINVASAREKSIRHGHPSTLHLWWARRPLAACRAVLFSSLVNDPGDDPMHSIDPEIEATERANLFNLIEELVLWENSNNPRVINKARLEIARSIAANKVADGELADDTPLVANAPELPEEQAKYLPDPPPEYTAYDVRWKMPGLKAEQVNHFLAHYAPPVLDPFAGGGSIPLEAQRLGLRAYASDLNPVPVLINKALIEIPPKFAGHAPVNPDAQKGKLKSKIWRGAEGLAEDVRYYGKWMRDEAEKRIGHLYPKVKVTQQMVDDGRPDLEPYVGQELTVIAWLWARTVKSPNPAAKGKHTPLMRSFWLSTKKGKEAFLRPNRRGDNISFSVEKGKPDDDIDPNKGTQTGRGASFNCLLTDTPIDKQHIQSEFSSGHDSAMLVAIVAEGKRTRLYLPVNERHASTPGNAEPSWIPAEEMNTGCTDLVSGRGYGFRSWGELFTRRQLQMLTTYSELLGEVVKEIGNAEYANAVVTYLGIGISKLADASTSFTRWKPSMDQAIATFARQALPMVWDFAESNPFNGVAGDITTTLKTIERVLEGLPEGVAGRAQQADARFAGATQSVLISTDPPYYDNISYADLSDFFYIWLRYSLRDIYPEIFGTMLTPKDAELVASKHRFEGNSAAAKDFFEHGLHAAIQNMRHVGTTGFPVTIYYAFKQSESDKQGTASTGWETFLSGVIANGFAINATWPIRTEMGNRMIGVGTNALASSIILACTPRGDDASMVTRRDFANALRQELPEAIKHLQSGNVAPVDLAQASIGPGMAVFSRYSKVVNADGSPMSVREALQLINQVLDESLVEQESDFDAETRFALRWFEQYGMTEGPFGDAETLSKAMAVSVSGIVEAGIAKSGAGKVRLLKREEMDAGWDPTTDSRLTMWEVAQHLIRTLESDGESGAGALLARIGSANGEIARELAYRLYQTCEKKKLAKEAGSYNGLVVSWPEITRLARDSMQKEKQAVQKELYE